MILEMPNMEAKMTETELKSCFVICPIGDENSLTRKRSNQVLKHIIEPVANTCGYAVERADKLSKPGMITTQIIDHIINDDLVIADLTERNPNVFYELAIRHAIRKAVVQIIDKNEIIPFDVITNRTIKFDFKDLDSVAECKAELEKQIEAVEKDPGLMDSPLSSAIDLQKLASSENPIERSNAEILGMFQQLKSDISYLKQIIASSQIISGSPAKTTVLEVVDFGPSHSPLEKIGQPTVQGIREDLSNRNRRQNKW